MKFMSKDFQLFSKTAKKLYFDYAKTMPIIDFHCHLSPKEIYEDKQFANLTEVWLGGDHYKWRAMRAFGIDEEFITGSASDEEKFIAWAKVVPYAIGNPLYHWTHMELETFFGIREVLNQENAKAIYDKANEVLKTLTARKMIELCNVETLCTTDDPIDTLEYHLKLQNDDTFKVKVLPAFRPDKAINIELSWFKTWISSLSKVVGYQVNNLQKLLQALKERIEFFDSVGCRLSDHALDEVLYFEATDKEVNEIFIKRMNNEELNKKEISKYKGYLMKFLGQQYVIHDWVQQYHIGALRNVDSRKLKKFGPNTGYDAINDYSFAKNLSKILDALSSNDSLPKTIIYCANPSDNDVISALVNSYQEIVPGKMQFGSAWWFNDHKEGMLRQMQALSNNGLVSKFVGMLTDSRSFLSYPRHDYFRRILCNMFGELIENGEYPQDIKLVGSIVQDICYYNAKNYFNF